jgi:hypothetical protein
MVFMPKQMTPDYLFEKVNQFLARSDQFESRKHSADSIFRVGQALHCSFSRPGLR